MGGTKLNERGVIILLCYINFLNYVDRGIIPGAPERFQSFISATLGVAPTQQNVYLGLLSTVFVASTAAFSLVFGYLSQRHRPFELIAFGMAAWVAAVMVCCLAYGLNSFYLLLFGRFLSGIGEASFHCNGMPFINRHAPKESSTVWLGVFIASISVGMAAGYVYGASMASSSGTWASAFFWEALAMLPPIYICRNLIPDDLNEIPGEAYFEEDEEYQANGMPKKLSFVGGCWRVFSNVAFSLVAFGHAAYTFTLGGFSVFCPVILIGMGFFDSETSVSSAFGAIIVISGTIGTVVGAMALDTMTRGNSVSKKVRSHMAVDLIFSLTCAAVVVSLLMMAFSGFKFGFLLMLAFTFFLLSAAGPAEAVAVMELFPESRQTMAVAANTVVILVLGDIPAPVVVGWLKDSWAPHCGTVETNGTVGLNPECPQDRSGMHDVLFFTVLWLVWAVVLWGGAKLVLRRAMRADEEAKLLAEGRSFRYGTMS
ncbi:hypothetical protein Poli38472_009544 [Pythium oligandrum]|uniref:Major facilitator superfamily (MFS) profile domain-containing protein n=1 Tax=Pythium oligandrum TaxID=41045 RepID=A0A8K1CFT3_PYTOL|nr:hypothetical protein Poli38472_009544 [Pythium oligandrum]|eukprot:TMW62051.1 hypothetical protein Poli38472_009544 [Pythium oligandrum]